MKDMILNLIKKETGILTIKKERLLLDLFIDEIALLLFMMKVENLTKIEISLLEIKTMTKVDHLLYLIQRKTRQLRICRLQKSD